MSRPCRHGKPFRRSSYGFSLIEILAVLVIVGILVSVVVLSFGALRDDREVEREAQRMRSLIQLAGDEAELQGRDFGIEFVRQGYRFVEYDPLFEQWTEIVGDEVFRPRTLPDGFELALRIEGRPVELHAEAQSTETEEEDSIRLLEKYAPHGLILSSGDLSPLSVDVVRQADGAMLRISIDLAGNVTVLCEGEEEGTANG